MDRRSLADELREGHAWRYADELVMAVGTKHSEKAAATDWELVKAASTCHACGRSVTKDEIAQAELDAHDYESFATLIAPCIEHASDCDADLIEDDEE